MLKTASLVFSWFRVELFLFSSLGSSQQCSSSCGAAFVKLQGPTVTLITSPRIKSRKDCFNDKNLSSEADFMHSGCFAMQVLKLRRFFYEYACLICALMFISCEETNGDAELLINYQRSSLYEKIRVMLFLKNVTVFLSVN